MTTTEAPTKTAVLFGTAEPLIHALSNALLFAGSDATVPALTSVKFEFADGKLTTISTDKYRLCISPVELKRDVDWATLAPFEFLLQREDVKDILAALKAAKRDPITLTYDGDKVSVQTLRSTLEFAVDKDHQFPNYPSLLPDPNNITAIDRIGFKGRFLADLGKVQTGNKPEYDVVEIRTYGERKPVTIQYLDGPFVLFMPFRLP